MKSDDARPHPAREPFLAAARAVLNAQVYCVMVAAPRPVDDASFVESVRAVLGDPSLAKALTAAVLAEDPIEDYLRCMYTPSADLASLAISRLSERSARRRLESMLLPRAPFQSPYGKRTAPEQASALVESFLNGFSPLSSHFAEVDATALHSWHWLERTHHAPPFSAASSAEPYPDGYSVTPFLDGLNDAVTVLGAGSWLALLINNGRD